MGNTCGSLLLLQDRVVTTEPAEVQRFAATTSHWDLYDSYMEEFARVQVCWCI
jgi:hypothetical protein